jgi:hypothetical protein
MLLGYYVALRNYSESVKDMLLNTSHPMYKIKNWYLNLSIDREVKLLRDLDFLRDAYWEVFLTCRSIFRDSSLESQIPGIIKRIENWFQRFLYLNSIFKFVQYAFKYHNKVIVYDDPVYIRRGPIPVLRNRALFYSSNEADNLIEAVKQRSSKVKFSTNMRIFTTQLENLKYVSSRQSLHASSKSPVDSNFVTGSGYMTEIIILEIKYLQETHRVSEGTATDIMHRLGNQFFLPSKDRISYTESVLANQRVCNIIKEMIEHKGVYIQSDTTSPKWSKMWKEINQGVGQVTKVLHASFQPKNRSEKIRDKLLFVMKEAKKEH